MVIIELCPDMQLRNYRVPCLPCKSFLCDLPGGQWFVVVIKRMRFLLMHVKKREIKSWAGQKSIIEMCYASSLVHDSHGIALVPVPAHLLTKPDVV